MNLREQLGKLGPGLLYAGAAVGVSHLVQSTRAGAEFGFQLLAVVVLVNVIKYPIFETGPRYAAATGKTLLEGYLGIGKWALWVYILTSILTMFIIMGAISIVTAGLFALFTGIDLEPTLVAMVLLIISTLILSLGHYTALDRSMKFVIIVLTVSTIFALIFSFIEPSVKAEDLQLAFHLDDRGHILFLVALIGWMPAPVDISIWHSVWSESKNKEQGHRLPLKQVLLDFKIGYWGTTLLAACFLTLGAMVMYGTSEQLANDSVGFAQQLVRIYTQNLGQWAFPFITLAALTTMFSTLLTCLDAFPRTLRKSTELISPKWSGLEYHHRIYLFWLMITVIGTSILLLFYLKDMRTMVDLATTLSFVIAPIFAILNFIAMNDKAIPVEMRQSGWLRKFNLASIFLLTGFSVWFLLY